MKVGVPKEIKTLEFRVGMTPAGVRELVHDGHEVVVETNAGIGIGMTDVDYEAAGAKVVETAEEVFAAVEMIVKVKEPQLNECAMLREDQVLFTYLHLAADPKQTEALVKSGTTAIAYETVTAKDGSLPLLTPMSEVAGRLSIQAGAFALQKANGGRGVLLGGVPGVKPGKVVIIGGGVSGMNAADMAIGLGADVTVLDRSLPRLTRDRRQLGRPDSHGLLDEARHRRAGTGGGPRRRCRAGCRCGGTEAGVGAKRQGHARRRRTRRHFHRPGRLLRNEPADHACRTDLSRARLRALLCHQHAGRGAAHQHVRADECNTAVR
jgi:NAD/NADP transhydrogenase alpha subunit